MNFALIVYVFICFLVVIEQNLGIKESMSLYC